MMKFRTADWLLCCFLAVLMLPLVILVIWSFAGEWPWPHLLPERWSLRGWEYLSASSAQVMPILMNSVWVSFVVTVVTLALSMPAARALALYDFRGKRFFELFFLSPMIIPLLSIGMGIHVHFIMSGLADTFLGVVLVQLLPCLPYSISILTDVFAALGSKLEQQARVLGASKLQVCLYVTLPLAAPGFVAAGIMVFIVSFSQYFLTSLIGGGKVITYALILFPYIQGGDRTLSAVLSLIFIVVVGIWVLVLELVARIYTRQGRYFYL